MKIAILDDWFDTLRGLACFGKLAGQEVTVFHDHTDDEDELASHLADAEALVLIRGAPPSVVRCWRDCPS
jgi:D-3-phosphoglycerate dehydrogenase / 2-oxoglutarate reductase